MEPKAYCWHHKGLGLERGDPSETNTTAFLASLALSHSHSLHSCLISLSLSMLASFSSFSENLYDAEKGPTSAMAASVQEFVSPQPRKRKK